MPQRRRASWKWLGGTIVGACGYAATRYPDAWAFIHSGIELDIRGAWIKQYGAEILAGVIGGSLILGAAQKLRRGNRARIVFSYRKRRREILSVVTTGQEWIASIGSKGKYQGVLEELEAAFERNPRLRLYRILHCRPDVEVRNHLRKLLGKRDMRVCIRRWRHSVLNVLSICANESKIVVTIDSEDILGGEPFALVVENRVLAGALHRLIRDMCENRRPVMRVI